MKPSPAHGNGTSNAWWPASWSQSASSAATASWLKRPPELRWPPTASACLEYAEMGHLQLWYATIKDKDILALPVARVSEREPSPVFVKAKKRGHLQVLEKMTSLVDEKQRIIEEAPLIVRERRTQQGRPIVEAVGILLHEYLQSLGHDSTTPSLQVPIGGCGSESGGSRKRRNTLLGDSPQGEQASAIRFSFSLKRLSPRSWRPISRPRFFKTKAGAS